MESNHRLKAYIIKYCLAIEFGFCSNMAVISVENDTEFQQKLSDAGPKLVVAQMTASW